MAENSILHRGVQEKNYESLQTKYFQVTKKQQVAFASYIPKCIHIFRDDVMSTNHNRCKLLILALSVALIENAIVLRLTETGGERIGGNRSLDLAAHCLRTKFISYGAPKRLLI